MSQMSKSNMVNGSGVGGAAKCAKTPAGRALLRSQGKMSSPDMGKAMHGSVGSSTETPQDPSEA